MVYRRLNPDLNALPATVTEELLRDGAYSEEFGWNHDGLANHARRHGMKAERLQFPTPEAFIDTASKPGALIVSIGHSFEREGKSGHLALVAGVTDDGHLRIHRPSVSTRPRAEVSEWTSQPSGITFQVEASISCDAR